MPDRRARRRLEPDDPRPVGILHAPADRRTALQIVAELRNQRIAPVLVTPSETREHCVAMWEQGRDADSVSDDIVPALPEQGFAPFNYRPTARALAEVGRPDAAVRFSKADRHGAALAAPIRRAFVTASRTTLPSSSQ